MLERFAKKQRMSDVVFLGGIEDAALPRLYATCDIFCAPSLYAEGFGIVLAEAMAAGKPVAAAANAGYQTLLSGEAARFLVRPGDVGALARALKELVTDASLRARLGEWGRREAKRYDNHALAPKFLTIYREAIRSRFGSLRSPRREEPSAALRLQRARGARLASIDRLYALGDAGMARAMPEPQICRSNDPARHTLFAWPDQRQLRRPAVGTQLRESWSDFEQFVDVRRARISEFFASGILEEVFFLTPVPWRAVRPNFQTRIIVICCCSWNIPLRTLYFHSKNDH